MKLEASLLVRLWALIFAFNFNFRPYNMDDYFIKRHKDFTGTISAYLTMRASAKRVEGIALHKERKTAAAAAAAAAAARGEFQASTANIREGGEAKRGPRVNTDAEELGAWPSTSPSSGSGCGPRWSTR